MGLLECLREVSERKSKLRFCHFSPGLVLVVLASTIIVVLLVAVLS